MPPRRVGKFRWEERKRVPGHIMRKGKKHQGRTKTQGETKSETRHAEPNISESQREV